jgi:hypothetical protein
MTCKGIETADTLRYRRIRFQEPRFVLNPGMLFMLGSSLFALAVFVYQVGG